MEVVSAFDLANLGIPLFGRDNIPKFNVFELISVKVDDPDFEHLTTNEALDMLLKDN